MDEWRELGPAWRAAFELAWEASGAGTIPVGAVVTDADGAVLARGRNRIAESSAPEGQIFGSRVAHAEINTLVQLGMDRRYFDCKLWTTLEPCASASARRGSRRSAGSPLPRPTSTAAYRGRSSARSKRPTAPAPVRACPALAPRGADNGSTRRRPGPHLGRAGCCCPARLGNGRTAA